MNTKFLEISGNYLQFNMHFFISMYVPCILYGITYAYTYIYIPYVSLHVLMHLHHLQGVLSLYFAKVIKINKVTNSIKSTD